MESVNPYKLGMQHNRNDVSRSRHIENSTLLIIPSTWQASIVPYVLLGYDILLSYVDVL